MAIHFDTQGPAPDGFHVPTKDEWGGVKTMMDLLQLTTGGNWKTYLHIPFAGYRVRSSNITYQGSNAYLWSSSSISGSDYAFGVYFNNSSSVYAGYTNSTRIEGLPVRCFKNEPVIPTSSWTTLYEGMLADSGVFWNSTDGLISISGDGFDWITIADKNLGATTVYNDGDTLTQANMGNMYQWGNNYGFPSTGTISKTSSTQVDASNYGPGNYYESDTFITGYNDWSSVYNNNLRGGVSQGTWSDPIKLHGHIGTWHMEHPLLSRSELIAIGTIANMLVELNKAPARYYNKFNSEGHIYNYTSGSIVYKCLSNDGTSIYYQSGTGKYAYYNESTGLWVGAGGGVY